jgi:hypothetical protein
VESSKGARDRRREVPLPEPKEGSKLAREIAKLAKLTKSQLWKRHEEVFGHEARSSNTKQLVDVIARRLVEQANDKGKKATPAAPDAESTADSASRAAVSIAPRDPRLPPVGTVLEREHNGYVHKVTVLEDGFEYEGNKHQSLSGLAKLITGAIWNGWVWFGLVKRPESKPESKKGASHAA